MSEKEGSDPKPYETRTISYYPKHVTITYLPEEIETVIGIAEERATIAPANEKLIYTIPQKRIWQKVHGYKGDSHWIEVYPDIREALILNEYSHFHRLNLNLLEGKQNCV